MKVGIIGLGKLGMPIALAMNLKGHDIMGYGKLLNNLIFSCYAYEIVDLNPACCQKESFPHREIGPNGEPSIEVSENV
jgi:hypothetical protein